MSTQKQEFHSHNSPWTEVYDMHCQREDTGADMMTSTENEEQKPTLDALADVYNREMKDTNSKRF